MKFKSILKAKRFWPSVFTMMVIFIVFYNVGIWGMEFGFDFDAFFQNRYVDNNLFRAIAANLIGGFFYGFIFIFLQFRSKLKREEEKQR